MAPLVGREASHNLASLLRCVPSSGHVFEELESKGRESTEARAVDRTFLPPDACSFTSLSLDHCQDTGYRISFNKAYSSGSNPLYSLLLTVVLRQP
jgi:hypothetical protein